LRGRDEVATVQRHDAQVLTTNQVRLYGYLDGTTSMPSKTIQVEQDDKMMKTEDNSAFEAWYAQDQ
jgi:hypothetical protein